MILNSEDRLDDTFDQVRIPEKPPIKPPDANIYQVEGGKIQEDFSIQNGPDLPYPDIAITPFLPPEAIDALPPKYIYRDSKLPLKSAAEPAEKNFLDQFFDWFNEMLRRIF